MELKDYILSERAFIHDISNQLVITQANSLFLAKALEAKSEDMSEKEKDKVEKLQKSVAKILTALKERKAFIASLSTGD